MRPLLAPLESAGEPPEGWYLDVARPAWPGGRPWVLANMVAGLDGSAASGGRSAPLSSDTDRRLFKALRTVADVVLVGAATVRNEHYGPAKIDEQHVERRLAAGRPPVPPIAVVTASLDLDWASPFFTEANPAARPIVITTEQADPAKVAAASAVADVIAAGDETVALDRALAALAGRGARVVLTEGGPSVLGGLIAAGVLDELCLTLSPLVGGDPLRLVSPGTLTSLKRFDLVHVLEEDGHLFLRYLRGNDDR